jgi:hypothetical protein
MITDFEKVYSSMPFGSYIVIELFHTRVNRMGIQLLPPTKRNSRGSPSSLSAKSANSNDTMLLLRKREIYSM